MWPSKFIYCPYFRVIFTFLRSPNYTRKNTCERMLVQVLALIFCLFQGIDWPPITKQMNSLPILWPNPPKSTKSQEEVYWDNVAPTLLGRGHQEFLNCLICVVICVRLKWNLSHGQVVCSLLNKLLLSEIAIKRKAPLFFMPIGKVLPHLSSLKG